MIRTSATLGILLLVLLALKPGPLPAGERTWFAEEFDSADRWRPRDIVLSLDDGRLHLRHAKTWGELFLRERITADFSEPVVLSVKVVQRSRGKCWIVLNDIEGGEDAVKVWEQLGGPGVFSVNLSDITGWHGPRSFRLLIGLAGGAEVTLDYLRVGRTVFDASPAAVQISRPSPAAVAEWREDFTSAGVGQRWTAIEGALGMADGKAVLVHKGPVGGILSPPVTMDFSKPLVLGVKTQSVSRSYLVKLYDVERPSDGVQVLGECERVGYQSAGLGSLLGWKGTHTFRVFIAGIGDEETDKVVLDSVEIAPPRDHVGQRLVALPPNRPPLQPNAFIALPLGAVKPTGWLRKQLESQAAGLSGHLDEFWNVGQFAHLASGWLGGNGEAWEMTPYYLDGILPLAYLLDDASLREKVARRIEWILESQRPDGQFGPTSNHDWWPRMPVLKALVNYHEATGDQRVIRFLAAYFHYQLDMLPKQPLRSTSGWATARGQDNLLVVHWLYNLTANPRLLELGGLLRAQTIDWSGVLAPQKIPDDFVDRWKKMGMSSHGVNVGMGVKFPALCWQQSGAEADRRAARQVVENLLQYHGQPHGVYSSDEHLHGNSPIRGTELCAVVEYIYSLGETLRILGDVYFADQLELAAYNALPAAIKPDMWGHQYIQQVNQTSATRATSESCRANWTNVGLNARTYGPGAGYYCCLVNFHQGWPKLVKNMVVATPDGGVATVVYGPCTAETRVAGDVILKLREETAYPFGDEIKLTLELSRPARFPLLLRIPAWAEGATVTINDQQQPPPAAGSFHRVERLFRNGDVVQLRIPMEVRLAVGHRGLVSVYRGPLLYGLKLGEDWRKYRGEGRQAFWEVLPTMPWNYGLIVDSRCPSSSFKVELGVFEPRAFKNGSAPVELKVQARRLPQWTMDNESPASIAALQTSCAPVETITLLPYGWTNIRIGAFPVVCRPSCPRPDR